MRFLVAGSSGLIGTALTAAIAAHGHEVMVLRRGPPGPLAWDPVQGVIDDRALDGVDAVVNLAGENIGSHRWSRHMRDRILASRTATTALVAERIARCAEPRPTLLNASAVGYYGSRGDEVLIESSGPGRGFLAGVCVQWEAATRAASDAGSRVVNLRTGVVLSARGGALARQLPLFRHGLGGVLGSGKQWVSWISLDDAAGAILHLAGNSSVEGPVNVTAPAPVTNRAFTAALATALGSSARLRVPAPALKAAVGARAAADLLLASQRAVPEKLLASGFAFVHKDLAPALPDILQAE